MITTCPHCGANLTKGMLGRGTCDYCQTLLPSTPAFPSLVRSERQIPAHERHRLYHEMLGEAENIERLHPEAVTNVQLVYDLLKAKFPEAPLEIRVRAATARYDARRRRGEQLLGLAIVIALMLNGLTIGLAIWASNELYAELKALREWGNFLPVDPAVALLVVVLMTITGIVIGLAGRASQRLWSSAE